jgi:hypothetical protein
MLLDHLGELERFEPSNVFEEEAVCGCRFLPVGFGFDSVDTQSGMGAGGSGTSSGTQRRFHGMSRGRQQNRCQREC